MVHSIFFECFNLTQIKCKKNQFEEGLEKTVRWYLENEEWLDRVTSGEYQLYYEKMYGARKVRSSGL